MRATLIRAALLLGWCAALGAPRPQQRSSGSGLRDTSDWALFREEQLCGGMLRARTQPCKDSGVCMVSVNATDLEMTAEKLVSVFLSESLAAQWNSYIGTVEHLGDNAQLQTYMLPWPFSAREYVVQCNEENLGGGGHRTRCTPVTDGHSKAPNRRDRVRGTSQTLWQMTPASNDPKRRSDLYFEGEVDPGGGLPKWLVNELGKHGSVNVVAALIKLTYKL